MDLKIKALYQCGACREIHDDEDEAMDCCRPDIIELYECPVCKANHNDEDKALTCCGVDAIKCPSCYRDYASVSLSHQAIRIAGHCTTCNPMFTIDQQLAIQDLHYQQTGKREHLHD
jgi:hypothetical protein